MNFKLAFKNVNIMKNKDFLDKHYREIKNYRLALPDKQRSNLFSESLFRWLFIPDPDMIEDPEFFRATYFDLQDQLQKLFAALGYDRIRAGELTEVFFNKLPEIRQTLIEDADAILQFDPAAQSMEEIFLTYPGFFTTALYRMAHQLWEQKISILPRLIMAYAHSKTGIDIHPEAYIGKAFTIDHGTGIVIGSSAHIGHHVKIYQGVTLGAIHVDKSLADKKRHPTIEDRVTIYAGTTILGGKTIVGCDSIIGDNVCLTHSVPAFSKVYQKSEIKVRNNRSFPDPIDFVI
ncbi:MAG: serine O-acetyltransferase [Flavobacteriales bacterium Tduv]